MRPRHRKTKSQFFCFFPCAFCILPFTCVFIYRLLTQKQFMMKKIYSLTLLAMAASAAFAQSYKLTEMSEETFAAGGGEQWSFQKYEYATGQYTNFAMFGNESTCNFLDFYNPERCMGERITEIDGYTGESVNNYWAANIRSAWYDMKYENIGTDDPEKFIYMSENFETYAQPKYAGVVTFTLPQDGYYVVNGTIVREDCAQMAPLYLIPRFRIQGAETVDSAVTMGMAFAYGDQGGQIEGSSNWNLSQGGEQRYVAQTPVDYQFAFYGKQGDKVSFETNAAKSYGFESAPRACWGRSFFKKLDIDIVDQATAEANEKFIDPYDMTGVEEFKQKLANCEVIVSNIDSAPDSVGDGFGQYSEQAINKIYEVITYYFEAVTAGSVNSMNVGVYEAQFDMAWAEFLNSKANINYRTEGNYVLLSEDALLQDVKVSMEQNEDNPFGYYYYEVGSGAFNKFENYTTTKAGQQGWCRNNGEWMYLNIDGSLHPDVARHPAILFTAPADGYYNVGISLYRPNPNSKVENPLYLRTRLVSQDSEGNLSCPKDQEMFSKQFGSVANDGQGGKAPIDLDFYVNLKAGDKISAEVEAYTSNRNSSAGTQITRFVVASMLSEERPITKEFVESTGLPVFDPYKAADLTALMATLDSARIVKDMAKEALGEDEGQYSPDLYAVFADMLAQAEAYVANPGDLTQYDADIFNNQFMASLSALMSSRIPFNVVLGETTAIRIAGTEKYLVQKDAATDHWYAAFMSMDDIIAQVDAGKLYIDDILWTFNVKEHEDGGYNLTNENGLLTADGYVSMLPPNPTDNYAEARLKFVTQNQGDSLVAICRLNDNLYWNTAFSWKSPYDKINTSSEPVYKFILCQAPADKPTVIEGVDCGNGTKVVCVEYFTVGGQKVNGAAKGLVIRRTTHEDGSISCTKVVR